VFNLLFVRVWRKRTEPFRAFAKRKRLKSLEELDAELSESSGHGGGARGRDHWTEAELTALRDAAGDHPRDAMIVTLLLMTGLRRRGLLNVRLDDIAHRDSATGRWVAETAAHTLTKGLHQHHFRLTDEAARAVERYLNTPEARGGRPRSPSCFLLPSGCTDNGQLSPTALTRAFKRVCARAGFAGDPRAHLHSMRHTHAHQLVDAGNDLRAVQASLGHRRMQTTERYVRDTLEDVMERIHVPAAWQSAGREPGRPRRCTRDVLAARRRRNEAMRCQKSAVDTGQEKKPPVFVDG
jgi:integrase